jgi:uncharacterized membrane protein YbhN (UPF0104 family)
VSWARSIRASLSEDELVRAELDEARRRRRTGRARIVGTLASVAVIGVVFAFALPRIADYGDVWDEIRKLSWQWLVVLGLATLLNLATYGPPLMAALPGLSYFHASRVTLASTALSVIAPGGAAAGMATTVAMLRARGFSGRPVGLAVVVMSVWNQSVILGFPILAVAGLAAQGARNRTLEIAALVGLTVFAVIVAGLALALSNERLANVGDRAARPSAAGRPPQGPGQVEWRVLRIRDGRFAHPTAPPFHRRDARRAPDGLRRLVAPLPRRHAPR